MAYNIVFKKGNKALKLKKVPKSMVTTVKKIYYNQGYNLVSQKKISKPLTKKVAKKTMVKPKGIGIPFIPFNF